jgi:hypothetical protein
LGFRACLRKLSLTTTQEVLTRRFAFFRCHTLKVVNFAVWRVDDPLLEMTPDEIA